MKEHQEPCPQHLLKHRLSIMRRVIIAKEWNECLLKLIDSVKNNLKQPKEVQEKLKINEGKSEAGGHLETVDGVEEGIDYVKK